MIKKLIKFKLYSQLTSPSPSRHLTTQTIISLSSSKMSTANLPDVGEVESELPLISPGVWTRRFKHGPRFVCCRADREKGVREYTSPPFTSTHSMQSRFPVTTSRQAVYRFPTRTPVNPHPSGIDPLGSKFLAKKSEFR